MATLSEAQANLASWEAASASLATSASYTMPNGFAVTRADGQTVLNQIAYWQRVVQQLQAQANGARSGRVRIARFTSRPV